jgi:hypothetical protein
MRRFVFNSQPDLFDTHDVARIVQVFADRGCFISSEDASKAWEAESESVCAGWLFLPDDDEELFWCVTKHCGEIM